MRSNDLYGKLFVMDRFFTIAVRKKQTVSIIKDKRFSAEYIVPANRQKWVADPILAENDNKTYLFYEAVLGNHGHIEVAEVLDDCTLRTPQIVLKDDYHYSYPFVFRYDGRWYMIPESSEAMEVRLYQAREFPEKWELSSVLLYEKAVDTTVFEQKGQLYMLTFFCVEGSERVIPHAYKLDLSGEHTKLKEIPWKKYDELRVRGAGPVFGTAGKLYRPAQVSQEQRYGDALAFYQVDAAGAYEEKMVGKLEAEDLIVSGYYADGLHTYCESKKFEVIDIRCGVINYFKPLHKVLNRLKR